MKTIKIIDLLIKISRGEEVPKSFMIDNIEHCINDDGLLQECDGKIVQWFIYKKWLNEEIEIIEEEKKIPEKINVKGSYNSNKGFEDFNDNEKILVDKINDLLDYLESKEKGE